MIQIQNLKFSYRGGQFDLNIPSLTIEASRASAVVGPSGSGKTTLLHLIAGILSPDSGSINVNNTQVSVISDSQRRRFRISQIGLIFQDFELIEYLSVLDNVLLPCRISDVMPLTAETRTRALTLLDQVGLKLHVGKSVTRLSQGERQRVAICRALLPQPAVLLADEPTGNLDPVTSQQILDVLLQTVREKKTTLVMVTHDHSLLNRFDETIDFDQFLTPSAAVSTVGGTA
jgi:putative ABC transport system ATP-binding protein